VERTKRCPSCAEDIRVEAVRCRHCRSDLPRPGGDAVFRGWIRAHEGLIIALATFLYAALQVYKAADFEVNAMKELLTSAGPTTIIVGAFLIQLPLELLLLSLTCCWWLTSIARTVRDPDSASRRMLRRGADDARNLPEVVLAALLVMSFFTSPWPFFLLSCALSVISVLLAHSRNAASGAIGLNIRRSIVAVGVFAFIYLVQSPTMWLSIESVTTKDRGTLVGYVVSEDGQWTTILTPRWLGRAAPGDNILTRIRSDTVAAREPCAATMAEARLFSPLLRLRPVQLVPASRQGHLPPPRTRPCP
jgi:hypothetical protein